MLKGAGIGGGIVFGAVLILWMVNRGEKIN
jgi:hypothetical protein